MNALFEREEILIGEEGLNKLKNAVVAVFGIGGVGSYVVEALVRAGIGKLILVDKDTVSISNINRQLIATTRTVGMPKVEAAKKRAIEINPSIEVEIYRTFYTKETDNLIDESIDYIVDAIDSVQSKISLIERAKELDIPIISCMGTGNKFNASLFEIADIEKTSVCPLAKIIRKELKSKNIKNVKVLYSKEEPIKNEKNVIGSISFVPSVAGLLIAGEVIRDLLK